MNFDGGYAMTIGGAPVGGGATFDVVNPATEAVIAQAPDAMRDQLDAAVDAARAAFPGWAATPIEQRRAALDALGDAILANIDPLKRLLTAEQGKPHGDAEMEIGGAGMWLKGAAMLDLPVTVNEDSADRYSETRHVPIAIAQRIASGTVWINETQYLTPLAAFGGMKQSGVGVEGGLEGLLEYTNAMTITRRRTPGTMNAEDRSGR